MAKVKNEAAGDGAAAERDAVGIDASWADSSAARL